MIPGQKLKNRKRAKTHGFFARMKTTGGQNVLKRRRAKKREELVVRTYRPA
ncbi:MAG: 50S ribosomal protein L34 [Patescibacteria group bacterium]